LVQKLCAEAAQVVAVLESAMIQWFAVDSQGRESRTFTYVSMAFLAVWVKFIAAGLTLPVLGAVPPMSAIDFGGAVGLIMGIWLGREWVKK
jgi:hypothetical protein